MRAVVGFSFLPFFNPKMVYFYPPILPIVYTQVWLQLISNLMWIATENRNCWSFMNFDSFRGCIIVSILCFLVDLVLD